MPIAQNIKFLDGEEVKSARIVEESSVPIIHENLYDDGLVLDKKIAFDSVNELPNQTSIPASKKPCSFEKQNHTGDVNSVDSKTVNLASLTLSLSEILTKHNISISPRLLAELNQEVIKELIAPQQEPKDKVLEDIELSAPLSYWQKECPELFDYPEDMHGYKTSWALLKGVYDPDIHKTLYYDDLLHINKKLYGAVGRRNRKENFLPKYKDKVEAETAKFIKNGISLSDMASQKEYDKYYHRVKRTFS